MKKISVEEVAKAVNGTILRRCGENFIDDVRTDSRECDGGDLFVAIAGERLDGHDYIPDAVRRGCRTVLVAHERRWPEATEDTALNVIKVDDAVYALGQLAKYYLASLDVVKVAVTGSVGKTTVRDMIYYVLSEKYRCGRNMKNYNNLIGLPLSVFAFDDSTQVVVLEMGMDRFGEIDRLAEIVKPNIAVITNIGMSHIENLGSRQGIFRAKMEIAGHITGSKRCPAALIFAQDEAFLTKETTKGPYRQISAGRDGRSDYIISSVEDFGIEGIRFVMEHLQESCNISVPVPGLHNATNSCLAIAVGDLLGVTVDQARRGLSKTRLTGSRLRLLEGKRVRIIDDTYNASPDSMKSALRVLERSEGRKIAVLGDMYELGEESLRQHLNIGVFARSLGIDLLVAIGTDAAKIAEGASGGRLRTAYYEKKEDFCRDMNQYISDGDIILVKGSRGMKMEQIVETLLKF